MPPSSDNLNTSPPDKRLRRAWNRELVSFLQPQIINHIASLSDTPLTPIFCANLCNVLLICLIRTNGLQSLQMFLPNNSLIFQKLAQVCDLLPHEVNIEQQPSDRASEVMEALIYAPIPMSELIVEMKGIHHVDKMEIVGLDVVLKIETDELVKPS